MGHYHDRMEKRFDRLGGLLAYPGSLDLSPSEGIKEVDKGFFITDISGSEANTSWIKLENRRPQLALSIDYGTIEEEVHDIIEKAGKYKKKPVLSLRVIGKQVDPKVVVSHLFKLKDSCLIYVWQLVDPQSQDSIIYQERPVDIDAELQKLAKDALGANDIAMFAINEILPLASQGDVSRTLELLWKVYSDNKFVSKEQAQERRRTP